MCGAVSSRANFTCWRYRASLVHVPSEIIERKTYKMVLVSFYTKKLIPVHVRATFDTAVVSVVDSRSVAPTTQYHLAGLVN